MQPLMSLYIPQSHFTFQSNSSLTPLNLRFYGLRRDIVGFSVSQLKNRQEVREQPAVFLSRNLRSSTLKVSASDDNSGTPPKSFDYDLVIIGAGVGGHGAALHAVEKVYYLKLILNICITYVGI